MKAAKQETQKREKQIERMLLPTSSDRHSDYNRIYHFYVFVVFNSLNYVFYTLYGDIDYLKRFIIMDRPISWAFPCIHTVG